MTEPHDTPTPSLSVVWEMVQKYREASGCEGKYLRGPPSLAGLGQLAAAEFGLTWQADPAFPPDQLAVTGDG